MSRPDGICPGCGSRVRLDERVTPFSLSSGDYEHLSLITCSHFIPPGYRDRCIGSRCPPVRLVAHRRDPRWDEGASPGSER